MGCLSAACQLLEHPTDRHLSMMEMIKVAPLFGEHIYNIPCYKRVVFFFTEQMLEL